MFFLEDYDYELPQDLIAQSAHSPADECKLMLTQIENFSPTVSGEGKLKIENYIFKDLLNLINPKTTIFFNNSKVLKARIPLINTTIITKEGDRKSVEEGEIFFLQQNDMYQFEALVRPGKKLLPGSKIIIDEEIKFEILETTHNGRKIKSSAPILEVLEKYGQLPLPPYIKYEKGKENDYQTVFAEKEGSVAAPTASLHFTQKLMEDLKNRGIGMEYLTLHVGIGTFKPVDVKDITKFDIHQEIIEISSNMFEKIANIKIEKHCILAVGTTVIRTLETLPYLWKYMIINNIKNKYDEKTVNFWNQLTTDITKEETEKIIGNLLVSKNNFTLSTKIFIYPGFKFKIVDEIITNFHLPKSSLLMLVGAFIGYDNMKKVYKYAIKEKYQFFSFGDAMYFTNGKLYK